MSSQLLAKLNRDWQEFLDSIEGLPDSALSEAGVVGTWSVRDIMGHVTTWEEEALNRLPIVLAHETEPGYSSLGGIDAFNAQKVTEKRGQALDQVRRDLTATHQVLLSRVIDIPDNAVDVEFERRFGEDTWDHYREHAEQIRAWRSKQ